jgi:GNAT superfamily N-acetyltransferase
VAWKLTPPAPLQPCHQAENFSCGETTLDVWLKNRALKNEFTGASRTYVLTDDARIIGYYALAVGSVSQSFVHGSIKRNMPDPVPVMLLGRLAVDMCVQGKGIGKALVRDAILRTLQAAEIAGIRALLVNAVNRRAADFYQACGFAASHIDSSILLLNLRNIRVS